MAAPPDGIQDPATRLRALLNGRAARLGFTADVIERLTRGARFTWWGRGDPISPARDARGIATILVAGAARIVTQGRRDQPLLLRIAPPGVILDVAWPWSVDVARPVWAVAHVDDTIIATLPAKTIARAIDAIGVDRMLALATSLWWTGTCLAADRRRLMDLRLCDRVEHVLTDLTRDFGVSAAATTRVALPLTHAELASLVGASRANVSRELARRRRATRL